MNEQNNNYHNSENSKNLTWGQKGGVIGLIILAVFVVLGWGFNLIHSIQSPIQGNIAVSPDQENSGSSCEDGNCSGDEDLKNKDTDGDGLSDWEELNVYDTSPYLEDTDGDGIPDGKEVEMGSDPNCPPGQDCDNSPPLTNEDAEEGDFSDGFRNPTSTATTSNSFQENMPDLNLEATSSQKNREMESILKGEGDPETLREVLLQAGMDKRMLDQISDEQLMESYKETINSN